MKYTIRLLLGLFFLPLLSAQYATDSYYQQKDLLYEDHIYQSGIRSVQLYPAGNSRGFPIISLGSGEKLMLRFDDLYEDYVNYSYTIYHCDADWTRSNLLKSDYLGNFQEYYIENYDYSTNALIPYTHYQLTIPNSNVTLTKSGNYVLVVYRNDDPEDIVLSRRFMVYEERVNVGATLKRPTQVNMMNTHQEIDFTINHQQYKIQNPFSDLQVTVMQNQRWDNTITDLKPQFLEDSRLVYQYDGPNTFKGINEFRFVDLKNLRNLSQNVRKINRDSVYMVYMKPEESRAVEKYTTFQDINGQYMIRRLDANNSNLEADYAWVDFLLKHPAPLESGDVYVYGKFSDWKLLPEYKLEYDYVRNAYRGQILLKQGYYNYMYATIKDGEVKTDIATFEGSHWETENTYQILVYNREVGSRYDKLVGYGAFNSNSLY